MQRYGVFLNQIMSTLIILHISLMLSALMLFIGAAAVIRNTHLSNRIELHRRLSVFGSILALLGIASIAVFKAKHNVPHLDSPHAVSGLVTEISYIVTIILGKNAILKNKERKMNKRVAGRISIILTLITALFGILRLIQVIQS